MNDTECICTAAVHGSLRRREGKQRTSFVISAFNTNLGTHLQQPKRKLVVRQSRDEQSEAGVHPFLQLPEQVLRSHTHRKRCIWLIRRMYVGGGRTHVWERLGSSWKHIEIFLQKQKLSR